jgi:hypothetical protein
VEELRWGKVWDPMRRGEDEGGAQEGRYPMSGAEKYARVCREGAVLGTGTAYSYR